MSNKKSVVHNGRTYSCIKELCNAHGVPYTVFMERLKRGEAVETALSNHVRSRGRSNVKPVTVSGVQFDSLKAACKAIGLPYSTMAYWRNTGKNIEQKINEWHENKKSKSNH
jgi:uncharacterized OB-fold protein